MTENNKEAWWLVNNIDEVDSPALLVYPDRVKKNIALAKSMIADVQRLRPHVKTHKSGEATALLMEAGVRKFKCATIAEAEMLGAAGAADVLLAYQPVGPKVQRLISLIKKYGATRYSCLVDNLQAAQYLSEQALKQGVRIPVYVDLNVGMNRTGIKPAHAAVLYEQCSKLKGIVPLGLHAYDGHVHDADLQVRRRQAEEVMDLMEAVERELKERGFNDPIIIAGGSPAFPIYAEKERIECSPGTFIYWDGSYLQSFKEQPFLPAALLITRVISLPSDTVICTDLGHKSVASENSLEKRILLLNAPALKPIAQSEEHLMLQTDKGHSYQVGDVFYALPYHICPTCALYERALVVEEGSVTGEWKTVARDRKVGC